MIRAAALASGDGEKLQAVLDAMYFGELPDFELSAVICPEKNAYVMQRALNARIPAYVVDPDLFPTMTTHSMAVANKLKDMDIELVLLVDYDVPLGVIPYQFKNRIIGTWPSLCPRARLQAYGGDLLFRRSRRARRNDHRSARGRRPSGRHA